MTKQIRINETLGVEIAGGGSGLRVIREGAGLVLVELSEVRDLVAALSELASRAAAEQSGEEFQGDLF